MRTVSRKFNVRQWSTTLVVLASLGVAAACSASPVPSPTASSVATTQDAPSSISSTGPVPTVTVTRTTNVLATKVISATSGGTVSAGAVSLRVPRNVLARDATATIREPAPHVYDLSLGGQWSGEVAATIPLSGPDDVVAHYVNGGWRLESMRPGQNTVWVDHLSPFTSLGKLLGKACLKGSISGIASCLATKGVKSINVKLLEGVVDNLNQDPCLQQLTNAGSVWTVPLEMFSGGCVGRAGDPTGWKPPLSSTSPAPNPVPVHPSTPTSVPPHTPAPGPPPVTSPPPPSKPIFTVMNTSETPPDGVWFRWAPHTADTTRTTGLGVYMNERVQLNCYGWGDAVGPYNDTLWYSVDNVSRPTNSGAPNTGWLNAHYIDDGQRANVVDAGVPPC